jgi:hypothetical protein
MLPLPSWNPCGFPSCEQLRLLPVSDSLTEFICAPIRASAYAVDTACLSVLFMSLSIRRMSLSCRRVRRFPPWRQRSCSSGPKADLLELLGSTLFVLGVVSSRGVLVVFSLCFPYLFNFNACHGQCHGAYAVIRSGLRTPVRYLRGCLVE